MSLTVLPAVASADGLRVTVYDPEGRPVPEVAIFAKALDTDAGSSLAGTADIEINQHDLAFEPHISVVSTGSAIRFPNSDDVRHHVYSFSDARQFDLTIAAGSIHGEPLVFDQAGVVTLGCNIHDRMLAYVLVVDTNVFALTDGSGTASLPLAAGRYEVGIWTPRLAASAIPAPQEVSLDEVTNLSFRIGRKLFPAHEHSETSLHWDY